MHTTRLLILLPLLLAVSCQSMSEGPLSLEGRAILFDDESLDGFAASDVDVGAYGVQLAVGTPVVDLLAAIETREYGNDDSVELQAGARHRFLEVGALHPFVEANLRYGLDLDTGSVSDDYLGYNLGGGVLFDIGEDMFLSARVLWESVDLSLSGGDVTADGVVVMVGFGIYF